MTQATGLEVKGGISATWRMSRSFLSQKSGRAIGIGKDLTATKTQATKSK